MVLAITPLLTVEFMIPPPSSYWIFRTVLR
jgi:hypothetical protein